MRRILKASALLSTVLFAAVAVASSPATDASTPTQIRPVRAMIMPAQIVNAPQPDFTNDVPDVPHFTIVVLKLNLSGRGKARNIEVVRSADPALNGPVIAAVRKLRFRPAMLDNRPVPIDMNLIVKVRS